MTSKPLPPRSNEKRYDLVESFDALALAGKRSNAPKETTARVQNGPPFVGGFIPDFLPPGNAKEREHRAPSLAFSKSSPSQSQPSFQKIELNGKPLAFSPGQLPRPPVMMTMPSPLLGPQSLTMRQALSPPASNSRPSPTLSVPNTPPSRPHSTSALPSSVSSSSPRVQSSLGSVTPKRPRAASSPPSPVSSSSGKDTVQCSGVTKTGKRCTRQVKTGPPLTKVHPDVELERFCFQHTKEVLGPSGFYSRKTGIWVAFEDWIPDYLHADTQVAIRVEMEKSRSQSDVPGYIYTFEIRDPDAPTKIQLKVGRAVNLVKRIDQWGKQCGSKEQVLRGWWPGTVEDNDGDGANGSLMKGRVRAGEKGPLCHRLERLVHLELADLAIHTPYLDPSFPKSKASTNGTAVTASTPSPRKASGAASSGKKVSDKPCPDCGAIHKEIFVFTRVNHGVYKGKEWESIVKPVIEKWGAFVEAYV